MLESETHDERLPRHDEHRLTSGRIEIDSRLDEDDEQRRFYARSCLLLSTVLGLVDLVRSGVTSCGESVANAGIAVLCSLLVCPVGETWCQWMRGGRVVPGTAQPNGTPKLEAPRQ